MSLKRSLRAAATLAASAALVTGVSAGTAQAAPTPAPIQWTAQDTVADVVGAHAYGTYQIGAALNQYTFNAHIKDTKADSHGARVYVSYSCGATCIAKVQVSASGEGDIQADTWTVQGPVTVQECLTEAGEDYSCGKQYTVIPG